MEMYGEIMQEQLLLKMDERQLKTLKLQLSLALILKNEFKKEFQTIHLSKQLYHSIQVFAGDDGKVHVRIPAPMYDVNLYRKRGVIKHISQNSYAMAVNRTGGFSGMHKDYVSKCIHNAINRWQSENHIDIERINTSLRS